MRWYVKLWGMDGALPARGDRNLFISILLFAKEGASKGRIEKNRPVCSQTFESAKDRIAAYLKKMLVFFHDKAATFRAIEGGFEDFRFFVECHGLVCGWAA